MSTNLQLIETTSNLGVIDFGDHKVSVLGSIEDPWFIAREIGAVFNIKNIRQNLTTFPAGWTIVCPFDSLGGRQETKMINEMAVYRIAMRSNKPEAIAFQTCVAKLLKELRTKGTVELKQALAEYKTSYEEIKETCSLLKETNKNLIENYKRLEENHKRILYKRSRPKLQTGPCFYIIRDINMEDILYFGITKNISERLQTYSTYIQPVIKLLIFTDINALLENACKVRYRNNVQEGATERIKGITFGELKDFAISSLALFGADYTVCDLETNEVIDSKGSVVGSVYIYNTKVVKEKPPVGPKPAPATKECRGCHLTLDASLYNKDRTKRDGLTTICKNCERLNKAKYKVRHFEVENSGETEKTCSRCAETKPLSDFVKHAYAKGGLSAQCRECVKDSRNARRQQQKSEGERFVCEMCAKVYVRRDTLTAHIRKAHAEVLRAEIFAPSQTTS